MKLRLKAGLKVSWAELNQREAKTISVSTGQLHIAILEFPTKNTSQVPL